MRRNGRPSRDIAPWQGLDVSFGALAWQRGWGHQHFSQGPLAYGTGGHLPTRRRVVLQHRSRGATGAGRAGVHQEALRSDPVPRKIQVLQARHPGTGTPREAAALCGRQRAHGLDARQELAIYEDLAPARLGRVEQVLQIPLVLTRVPGTPGVELLEGVDERRPFGGDLGVE